MAYVQVPSPTGGQLFKYDAERQIIEIKLKGGGTVHVDLTRYQHPPRATRDAEPPPVAEHQAADNQAL